MRAGLTSPRALLLAATLSLSSTVWAGDSKPEDKSSDKGKSNTQAPETTQPLQWLDYGKALDRAKREDKHVVVDFYTDWCGWCKRMDHLTYGDATVSDYLRKHFVLAKVNAESGRVVKIGDEEKTEAQVAREFGVRAFPITWFLQPDGKPIGKREGFVKAPAFMGDLQFVHERQYQKSN